MLARAEGLAVKEPELVRDPVQVVEINAEGIDAVVAILMTGRIDPGCRCTTDRNRQRGSDDHGGGGERGDSRSGSASQKPSSTGQLALLVGVV